MRFARQAAPYGRGSSMIEVLVALALVAFTMLGLLAIQLRTQGMQKDSLDRRAAALIAADFLERATGNSAGFLFMADTWLEIGQCQLPRISG